jgi:VWFA-related protein
MKMGAIRMLPLKFLSILAAIALVAGLTVAQSGKGAAAGRRTLTLNVIVHAPKDVEVNKQMFDLYDQGIVQEVENFKPVETGSRIVLLVDNTSNLKAEAVTLQKAALAVIDELYQDDQMMVVGYNESAEIIQDTTGELAKLQISAGKFIRKGFPHLFDALVAVSDALSHQSQTGAEKRAIILISDGYDSESQVKFGQAMDIIQDSNLVIYALQVQDRTHGALLRDKPKPPAVLEQLTVGTGGAIFPLDKAAEAAKTIADDLRNNWYSLTYTPTGVNTINSRRLLIVSHDKNVELRTKGSHPGTYRALH